MLRLAVAVEIVEALIGGAHREVAVGHDQLVAPTLGQRDHHAGGCDDAAMGQHVDALLRPRLARGRDPDPVLIGGRLHADEVMEGAKLVMLRPVRQLRGRVVAEDHHLRPLQRHHPIGLGPAPVVADRHADLGPEGLEDGKAQIAGLEIHLLQMLEGQVGDVHIAAGHMDLAILADDAARPIDEDGGIEAPLAVASLDQLAIAEIEADAESRRSLEQRRGGFVRYLALEEAFELGLVGDVPAGKEGRQRHLGKDGQGGAARLGRFEQSDQPPYHGLAGLLAGDGAELSDGEGQAAIHEAFPLDSLRWPR